MSGCIGYKGLRSDNLLIRKEGLDSPKKLRVLMEKNVDDICNIVRKSDSKNADRISNRGQQVSIIPSSYSLIGGNAP